MLISGFPIVATLATIIWNNLEKSSCVIISLKMLLAQCCKTYLSFGSLFSFVVIFKGDNPSHHAEPADTNNNC